MIDGEILNVTKFSFYSTSCQTSTKEHCLFYYLSKDMEGIDGLMPLLRIFRQKEKRLPSSRLDLELFIPFPTTMTFTLRSTCGRS